MKKLMTINKNILTKSAEAIRLLSELSDETGFPVTATVYRNSDDSNCVSILGNHCECEGVPGFTKFDIFADGRADIQFIADTTGNDFDDEFGLFGGGSNV